MGVVMASFSFSEPALRRRNPEAQFDACSSARFKMGTVAIVVSASK
jgi:hypothetical protein